MPRIFYIGDAGEVRPGVDPGGAIGAIAET